MFYYVSGTLSYSTVQYAVVDCGGVGYKCTVSRTTSSKLPFVGSQVKLFTYLSVKEDGIELFGFLTEAEQSAFTLLITVSGVGPKAALSILSEMTPEGLSSAVGTNNIKALSKAQGIGSKTAARIILELKDKIAVTFGLPENTGEETVSSGTNGKNGKEAVQALTVLGYTEKEAQAALEGLNTDDTLENLVTAALRRLSRGI